MLCKFQQAFAKPLSLLISLSVLHNNRAQHAYTTAEILNMSINILNWIFQSTTALSMSSSAPVVTSVSTPSTDVMESLIAVIALMSKAVVSITSFGHRLCY